MDRKKYKHENIYKFLEPDMKEAGFIKNGTNEVKDETLERNCSKLFYQYSIDGIHMTTKCDL